MPRFIPSERIDKGAYDELKAAFGAPYDGARLARPWGARLQLSRLSLPLRPSVTIRPPLPDMHERLASPLNGLKHLSEKPVDIYKDHVSWIREEMHVSVSPLLERRTWLHVFAYGEYDGVDQDYDPLSYKSRTLVVDPDTLAAEVIADAHYDQREIAIGHSIEDFCTQALRVARLYVSARSDMAPDALRSA